MNCAVEVDEFQQLLDDLEVIQSLGNDTYLTVYGTIIMVKEVEE
jgi:hypothetical protein